MLGPFLLGKGRGPLVEEGRRVPLSRLGTAPCTLRLLPGLEPACRITARVGCPLR